MVSTAADNSATIFALTSEGLLTRESPRHCLVVGVHPLKTHRVSFCDLFYLLTVFFFLVWFCLPDVGERSGALKVNPGIRLIAGGLASVRVGGHTVETNLVAPGQEVKAKK